MFESVAAARGRWSGLARRMGRAVLMGAFGLAFAHAAHAQFATGGSGLHKNRIFWVSFGNPGDNVYAGRTITRSFNIGTPATAADQMSITCTLSNAATTRGTAALSVYTPGSWQGDGLDDLYNIGGAQQGTGANPNTLAIGLVTNGGSTVEFDFNCSATLGGAPFTLNGLVFADAEASGGTEYVAARLTSGGTLRIIDSISNCGNAGTVSVLPGPPQEVRLVPGAAGSCEVNATPSLRAGPALVGFIEGATAARVIARGSGQSAVAVGAVLDLEYSEAIPASYGVATHVLESSWSGGLATSGVDYTNPANLATFSTAPPRLGTLNLPDADANGPVGGADVDALPKTTGPLGGGYASVAAPTARGAAYTISGISCFGPGSVAGWIDFNGNGVFDAGERSSVASCGAGANTVSLSWTVPAGAGYVVQPTSYMRLRIGPNVSDVDFPTGIVTKGETEDYRLGLPSLSADMSVSLSGFPSNPAPGSTVSGTVLCTNNGPDPAAAPTCSVPLASLPPGASVVCGAAPASLAVGSSISCAVSFTMPASGSVTINATAGSSTPDPVASNNPASTPITAASSADMSAVVSGLPSNPAAGSTVTGSAVCTNNGPDPAVSPSCTVDTASLPPSATVSCPAAANPLPVGSSVVCAISFTAPAGGTISVGVTAGSATTDPNGANNSASSNVVISPRADLSASASVPTLVTPGSPVTVTGRCVNNGPSAAASPSCSFSGLPPGAVTVCTPNPLPASLAAGAIIDCSATFTAPASGTLSITTTAGSTTVDPNASNNAAVASTGPIDAVNDVAPAPVAGRTGGVAVANVLANDTLNGAAASLTSVTLVQTASTQPGVSLDASTGGVTVAPGTPAGSYLVTYRICSRATPAACDTATVAVTVTAAPIDAIDDPAVTLSGSGGSTNVLTNDTLAGAAVLASEVTTSVVSSGGLPGLAIDAGGNLVVPPGSAAGSYSVTYRICERLNPSNCDTATVPVIVQGAVSGSVWMDNGAGGAGATNRQRDGGEPGLSGWVVEAIYPAGHPQAGQIAQAIGGLPATALTDASGAYALPALAAGNYQLRFRAPGASGPAYGAPVNGEQGNPQPGSVLNAAARTLDITVPLGGGLSQQSLPVDPSGVVYDAVTRVPVTGAAVTLLGPDGQPVATQLLLPGQQGQQVISSGPAAGSYRFDLLPGAPAGVYTISVSAPAGYSAPSATIPPAAVLPYQAGPAPYLVAPSAQAPQGGEPTTYHLQVTLNPPAGGADILHNHIPLDPAVLPQLSIDKRAAVSQAEVGDFVRYTIRVRNLSASTALPAVSVVDTLPGGFSYVADSARLQGMPVTVLPNPSGAPGPQLLFALGALAANQTVEFSYHLKVGATAVEGDGTNRAFAQSGSMRSLTARATVKVAGGVFRTEACLVGKIYSDCGNSVGQGNGNGIQDPGEPGIPGVRFYLEDGTWVTSDSQGKYSLCGLTARTHVLKADATTLPPGARLGVTSSRNAGDPGSLFVDVKKGELVQADFRDMSCSAGVAAEIERRRDALRKRKRDDDVNVPNVMGAGRSGPGLGLEGSQGRAR